MPAVTVSPATLSDFESIKQGIALLDLDDRDLDIEQFLVAKEGDTLIGFGRIRKHNGCDEYCTLGIFPAHHNKGAGKLITSAIIDVSTQPIYLVCIIPTWFVPFGFEVVNNYPNEMQDKLDYCNAALTVPEEYVVMGFKY